VNPQERFDSNRLSSFEEEAAFNVAMENMAEQSENQPYFFALRDAAQIESVIKEAKELRISSVDELLQNISANTAAERKNSRLVVSALVYNALAIISAYCNLSLDELHDQLAWQRRRQRRDELFTSLNPDYLDENVAGQLKSAITTILETPELRDIAQQKCLSTFSGLIEEMEGVFIRFPTANSALRQSLSPQDKLSYDLARYRCLGVEKALIALSRIPTLDTYLPYFWGVSR
jgi:hypothetical protein